MQLGNVLHRILAGATVFGLGVGCACPPTSPSETVQTSEPFRALVGEAAEAREREHCEATCSALDPAVEGWRCTFAPLVTPTSAECVHPTSGTSEVVALDDPSRILVLQLPQNDCEALCMLTDGWAVAEEERIPQDAIACRELSGDTEDELSMVCEFGYECFGGRRPRGDFQGGAAAGWWAAMARLEHVSIRAFEELARDLLHLGAPEGLVQRALEAADDERRHTALCVARARAAGHEVRLAESSRAPTDPRPVGLHELARHNSREGCVRESYAALEAGWQALHAPDPADRAVLSAIHADEVRHGQLAWDIQAWVGERIDVRADLDAAFAELARSACGPGPGLPDAGTRRALVEALWAAAA
ncbi:MAG: hypothetical protein R3F61_14790 [Myxococcota bacterium]